MDVAYVYTKSRRNFGRAVEFGDFPAIDAAGGNETKDAGILEVIPSGLPTQDLVREHPACVTMDTTPTISCSNVSTKPVALASAGVTHTEGGWPAEIDVDDEAALQRYRKRKEKGAKTKGETTSMEPLGDSVKRLGPVCQLSVKQNNTINIYNEYFEDFLEDHSSEPPSAKGMAVLRDPCPVRRTTCTIDWLPEGPTRIAAAYSVLRFQDSRMMQKTLPVNSYCWDVQKPNAPETTLVANSPLCSLRFNPKAPDALVGGCYNGLVCHFDRRKSNKPCATSMIETSHHDPVYDVKWTQSKTGTMCVSCSTDGQMLWWDTRRLSDPCDQIQLVSDDGKVLGASSIAYNTEAGPHKYLVGTEQGVVSSVNTRAKKVNNGVSNFSSTAGKHHAPIYSIERNPVHVKYFMTVGDWTARIWTDDLKTPIMTTKYHASYLTSGCWSPTRPGVFFVTRKDGVMDVWDYFFRQNEVAYSHKVCEESLSSIAVSRGGNTQLVAVGDDSGTISLMELSDSLWRTQNNEKPAISGMFDREFKREKNLVMLAREADKRQKRQEKEAKANMESSIQQDTPAVEEQLLAIEQNFVTLVKDGGSK